MRAVDIIIKKRDKGELTLDEIEFFIKSFISGEVADYQASAFAMAVAAQWNDAARNHRPDARHGPFRPDAGSQRCGGSRSR